LTDSIASVPNYCAEDGAQLDVVEDGLAKKATCPDCGERWYGSLVSSLLWRLSPSLRDSAEQALRWWFDRPCATPGLSLLRMIVLFGVVGWLATKLSGFASVVVGIGALVAFFIGVESVEAVMEESSSGPILNWHDLVIGALAAGVLFVEFDPVLTIPALPTLSSGLLRDGFELVAGTVVAVVSFHIVSSVGIRLHERLHWLAFRAVGVDARVEYRHLRVGGVSVGLIGGEAIPRPASWTGTEWQHLVTGFAPMLLIVPLAVVYVLIPPGTLVSLPWVAGAAVLGGGFAALMSALPSGGDMSIVLGTGRYRDYVQAQQAEEHRVAEGLTAA
jgi:hypothetical protein